MSESFPYADIIILGLVAVFILLRLRSVLGQRGEDSPWVSREQAKPQGEREPIIQLSDKASKPKIKPEDDSYLAAVTDTAILTTIQAIKDKDPQFTATAFLAGAKAAFEMVFDAFAKGDKATLKMLLADSPYQAFGAEIDARVGQEHKTETTLVSVKADAITQASLSQSTARLCVHFASEQIILVRNGAGDIVEGSPSDVHHVENHWVFERDVTSKNPNWKIVET